MFRRKKERASTVSVSLEGGSCGSIATLVCLTECVPASMQFSGNLRMRSIYGGWRELDLSVL
ncbi:hypothetical protein PR202_gb07660 [Eleusine coracana subsp. coracana]|uniref:Uncharacterized protein n=1 Tax=Eleusine coracana subsp. coracana TaxID=191504 RepID=A0AAV5ECB7_ELECO|nr:hypothetical protein PR202_gb07660 [Eleusine coracana subsp. coracana]